MNRVLRHLVRPRAGQFQPYTHTEPDRYPWLFRFAAEAVADGPGTRLLSFGCSKGDEVLALRKYFPHAAIKGIDIGWRNIARCRARAPRGCEFSVASDTKGEPPESYDAIFCLAVLCHGDLTKFAAESCEPFVRFADFDATVGDFARCLKPGGVLFLHTANFRFGDSSAADGFEVLFEAPREEMAPDVQFGRDNRRLDEVCRAVAFRKKGA
ncbi:MAG TPA: class I SAM-dependent methyltransferase [Rhizomicrobium sp.]|nr:class I SAM-dependent methyltransferase [Rhizomicrobium sp.]